MASIKFGNVVVDMKGKVSGNVYAKNKGGAYSRVRVIPANPKSVDQEAVRANFTALSQAWRGLTQTQRDSWYQASINFPRKNRIGDVHNLSGNALYNALNRNLFDVGLSAIATAPTPASVGTVSIASVVADNSAQTLVITLDAVVPAGTRLKIFASATLSAGINSVGTKLRQIDTAAVGAGVALTETTAYLAKFGAIGAVGSKIFISLVPVNTTTGQAGATITATTVIVV
jgi:hypothetical protein